MGYSPWGRQRDGHDSVTKQQYEVTENPNSVAEKMGEVFSSQNKNNRGRQFREGTAPSQSHQHSRFMISLHFIFDIWFSFVCLSFPGPRMAAPPPAKKCLHSINGQKEEKSRNK